MARRGGFRRTVGLLFAAAVASAAADIVDDDGSCPAGSDAASCVAGGDVVARGAGAGASDVVSAAQVRLEGTMLEALVLADDGVRLQLVQLLPRKARSAPLRFKSQVAHGRLVQLPHILRRGPSSEEAAGVFVLTFDGAASWYIGRSAGDRKPLKSMGDIPQAASGVAAIDVGGYENGLLTLGRQNGTADVWRLVERGDRQAAPRWDRVSAASGAHHAWERVTRVAASPDGRFIVACTDDNTGVWRLPATPDEDPFELRHLHGGDWQVSALHVAQLKPGSHLIAVAFQSGAFEGWRVDEGSVESVEDESDDLSAFGAPARLTTVWQETRRNSPRLMALSMALEGATARGGQGVIAAADADGQVMLWTVDGRGRLAGAAAAPRWAVRPSAMGFVFLAIDVLTFPDGDGLVDVQSSPCWVAAGCEARVVALDCSDGKVVHESIVSGSVLAVHWR